MLTMTNKTILSIRLKFMSVFKNNNLVLTLMLFLAGIIFFATSCKKNSNTMVDYSFGVELSSDYASAQHLSVSLANTYFKCIYDTALMNTGHATIDGANIQYSVDSLFQLKIIYPPWGNDDGYGNWRQGEIHIRADGGFFNENEDVKFNFESFNFSKDTIVAHDYSIKYLGNTNFQMLSDSVCRIMEDTTGIIVFYSQQQFNVGLDDSQTMPEQLNISGLLQGKSRGGYRFETTTKEDIFSDLTCNWMKQGEVEILYEGVDYSGTMFFSDTTVCDNWYNLVIDGVDFPSKIQKPKWQ